MHVAERKRLQPIRCKRFLSFKAKIHIARGDISFQWVEAVNEYGSDNNNMIILNCKILLSLIWIFNRHLE